MALIEAHSAPGPISQPKKYVSKTLYSLAQASIDFDTVPATNPFRKAAAQKGVLTVFKTLAHSHKAPAPHSIKFAAFVIISNKKNMIFFVLFRCPEIMVKNVPTATASDTCINP